jgi:uncharacterized Fe-S cluster-containing radical SAM superfamily protein
MGSNIENYLSSNALKNLKHDLLNNVKNSNCEWCWDNEKNNMSSHRRQLAISSDGLTHIHLRLNNVCNFKCRMCNPNFSSTWEIENRKHNYFKHTYDVTKDIFEDNEHLFDLLKTQIKSGSLKYINISGGEPLITDAHWRLLTFLVDNSLTNVSLSYSTNLSNIHYKNVNLLDLWKQFKNVTLEASCDGWGPAVEYSRTGFDRKVFLDNVAQVIKHVRLDINCVVNAYSVWTLPDIEKFREKLQIRVHYSPCYLPEFLNPQRLLREDKESLRKLYAGNRHLEKLFNDFIDTDLPTLGKDFISYNKLLDVYRGTNFFDVFPQYEKYNNF